MRRTVWALLLALSACGSNSNSPSSLSQTVNIAGENWTLQTHASATCVGLPPEAMSRSYPVTITQDGLTVQMFVTTSFGRLPMMSTNFIGSKIQDRLVLTDMTNVGLFHMDGTFTSVPTSNTISGALNGILGFQGGECIAVDHSLTFTR